MTFEVAAYSVMALGAYLTAVSRQGKYVRLWVVLFLIYSVAARIRVPANDMTNYVAALGTWPPALTFYSVREPVVWLGLAVLGRVIPNQVLALVVMDTITCCTMIWAFRRMDDGSGRLLSLAPTFLASFVFLFGMQNVLRQHLALVILICSIGCVEGSSRRAILLFILAGLTHNGIVMLFGCWWDAYRVRKSQNGWIVTAGGVALLALVIDVVGKSSSSTGANTIGLYLGVALAMAVGLTYVTKGRGLMAPAVSSWRNYFVVLPTIGFLGEAQFERVSMMFLILMLLAIGRYHRYFRIRWGVVAHVVCLALIAPVVLFPAAWGMLHT